MGQFIIRGGKSLGGEISVGGSKNAALPIIFSCITICGISKITNLPDIGDVEIALDILRDFGASVVRTDEAVTINTKNLVYCVPDDAKVSKIRASSYLLGACLSRFGKAKILRFGGCNFDNRPIDMHLMAAKALGCEVSGEDITVKELMGADIHFDKVSVGATVNAILLTVCAKGHSRIFGYAREPHVIALIDFLNCAGGKIKITDEFIFVEGRELSSAHTAIIPDMIEAGTYLALSLMMDSQIKVVGAHIEQLYSFLDALVHSGAIVEFDDTSVTVSGRINEPLNLVTAPYPAFPTDLHPQTVPLIACSCGGSVEERVWRNRFGYLAELGKFGVEYKVFDGYAAISKSTLHCATATAPDLRGGAALLIAALYADGVSNIYGTEIIKRGYADVVKKLRNIGADIIEI